MAVRIIAVGGARLPERCFTTALLAAAAIGLGPTIAGARVGAASGPDPASGLPRPCAPASTLAAYSHNDERQRRPLAAALELGYAGVEVDLHYTRGRLLVGHDLEETRPDRTFESLYLRPLAAIAARCGGVRPDGKPFLLLVDLKSKGMPGYRALRAALAAESTLVSRYSPGETVPRIEAPVTVVLVGWLPPLDSLRAEPVRYVAPHRALDARARRSDPRYPADRLTRMISLDASKLPRWSGRGDAPAAWGGAFERLRELAATGPEGPERIARVHHLPVNARVYEYARSHGADIVGTERLDASRPLLDPAPAH